MRLTGISKMVEWEWGGRVYNRRVRVKGRKRMLGKRRKT